MIVNDEVNELTREPSAVDFDSESSEQLTVSEINLNVYDCLNLSIKEKTILADLLRKYHGVISKQPGTLTTNTHKLTFKDDQSFYVEPYPIPMNFKSKVRTEVEKMLKFNIVRYSTNSYINPVTIVSKSDNSVRWCKYAQQSNIKLYEDHKSTLRIESIFQKYQINKLVSLMDIASSAALIRALDYAIDGLRKNASQKTAHLQIKPCLYPQTKNKKFNSSEMKILLAEFRTKLKTRIKNLSDLRKYRIFLNKLQTDEERSSRLQSNKGIGTLVRDCTVTHPYNLLRRLDKRISYEEFTKRKEKGST